MTTIIIRGTYTEHLRFLSIAGGLIMKHLDSVQSEDKYLHKVKALRPFDTSLTDGMVEYSLDDAMWAAIKPELRERLSEDNLLAGWDYWDSDICSEYILF